MSRLPVLGPEAATRPLPTVQALQALWQEVASRPLWAPPNFLRYLRLRRQTRLAFVDSARLRILAPPGKINDCSGCTEICCVGAHATVSLRLRDIGALIDLGRTDLIAFDKPRFDERELERRPALQRTLGSTTWRCFPVLRQTRMGACAALSTEGRCGLHPHWPLSCARFPYALNLEAHEIFYSRRCSSFWIRADSQPAAQQRMVVAAAAAYNERIKDLVLLAYARARLEALGLTRFLLAPLGSAAAAP